MNTTPTLRDWATGLAGYLAEAYAMELPETIDLIGALTRVLSRPGIAAHLTAVAVPLAVREQCEHNAGLERALGAGALSAELLEPALRVPAAHWGEFAMEFLEAHRWSDGAQSMKLWFDFTQVFDEFGFSTRPVVYLAVPLQQALPLEFGVVSSAALSA